MTFFVKLHIAAATHVVTVRTERFPGIGTAKHGLQATAVRALLVPGRIVAPVPVGTCPANCTTRWGSAVNRPELAAICTLLVQ
ncbi:MAG TPA: hypothetical protein VKY31_00815 [Terriglobia bacterium]|nr:hypothetical protein [Terriglobia bacterium]